MSHHSCGRSARLDVLLVFMGCIMWQESEKSRSRRWSVQKSFNLQDCATQNLASIIKLAEGFVNIRNAETFNQVKFMQAHSFRLKPRCMSTVQIIDQTGSHFLERAAAIRPARHKLHSSTPRESLCSSVLILNYNFLIPHSAAASTF